MAYRYPLYLVDAGGNAEMQEADDTYMGLMNEFAGYVHSIDPAVKLEVNTANGTLLSGQPFTDTYYIAGTYVTRVDRFATEAETPNISLVTDNYNRLRLVNNQGTDPTSTDLNNLQYPLYLTAANQLQAMTPTDFFDTFVSPVLAQFGSASVTPASAGRYFLSTSTSVANAVLVSGTPVAVNSVADITAYTASSIPETTKQTIDTNYYLHKYEFAPETYTDNIDEKLPIYWDFATGTFREHTPASWAGVLGPWLRWYLGGADPNFTIGYNINGSGTQAGTSFVDSRVTPTGTGYNTRFVNSNDYRTQEFPTGTESTVSGSTKTMYFTFGTGSAPTGTLTANTASVQETQSVLFTITTSGLTDGTTIPYAITGITQADLSSGTTTGNFTITSNTGTVTITLADDFVDDPETLTMSAGGDSVQVTVTDAPEVVQLEGTSVSPVEVVNTLAQAGFTIGWEFWGDGTSYSFNSEDAGRVQRTLGFWNNKDSATTYYIRATNFSGINADDSFAYNTWHALSTNVTFYHIETRDPTTYGTIEGVIKVDIATDAAGTNIIATGYYKIVFNGLA